MKIKFMTRVCSVGIMVLFVIIALGPGNWAPRTGFGFQLDHFLGYLALTSLVCLAWPRPVIVGGALMAGGALLESLQVFTPNHHADLVAASCGAGGALVAALLAELFIRIGKWTIRRGWSIHAGSATADRTFSMIAADGSCRQLSLKGK